MNRQDAKGAEYLFWKRQGAKNAKKIFNHVFWLMH